MGPLELPRGTVRQIELLSWLLQLLPPVGFDFVGWGYHGLGIADSDQLTLLIRLHKSQLSRMEITSFARGILWCQNSKPWALEVRIPVPSWNDSWNRKRTILKRPWPGEPMAIRCFNRSSRAWTTEDPGASPFPRHTLHAEWWGRFPTFYRGGWIPWLNMNRHWMI